MDIQTECILVSVMVHVLCNQKSQSPISMGSFGYACLVSKSGKIVPHFYRESEKAHCIGMA